MFSTPFLKIIALLGATAAHKGHHVCLARSMCVELDYFADGFRESSFCFGEESDEQQNVEIIEDGSTNAEEDSETESSYPVADSANLKEEIGLRPGQVARIGKKKKKRGKNHPLTEKKDYPAAQKQKKEETEKAVWWRVHWWWRSCLEGKGAKHKLAFWWTKNGITPSETNDPGAS